MSLWLVLPPKKNFEREREGEGEGDGERKWERRGGVVVYVCVCVCFLMHCVTKATSSACALRLQSLQQPILVRLRHVSRAHATDPLAYIHHRVVPSVSFSFYQSHYRQQQQRRALSTTHRGSQHQHRLFSHQNASVTSHYLQDTSTQRRRKARTEYHISMEASKHATSGGGGTSTFDPIVQYVVIRRDLRSDISSGGKEGKATTSSLAWPFGSVVAQVHEYNFSSLLFTATNMWFIKGIFMVLSNTACCVLLSTTTLHCILHKRHVMLLSRLLHQLLEMESVEVKVAMQMLWLCNIFIVTMSIECTR